MIISITIRIGEKGMGHTKDKETDHLWLGKGALGPGMAGQGGMGDLEVQAEEWVACEHAVAAWG